MTMRKPFQYALLVVGLVAAAALIFAGVQADRLARIGAGYKAKVACSEIFLAGRDAQTVIANEFDGIDPMMEKIRLAVDAAGRTVEAAGPLGLGRARAVYREGYGCTLANGGRIRALPAPEPPAPGEAWPTARPISGEALYQVDYAALDFALTEAFENNDAGHRAVLVAVDGKLADERYADGFSKDTPMLSWSMAKSVTATVIGAAVERGLIDIAFPAPAPEWEENPHNVITWDDLLHMQSGLAFEEEYGKTRSDVNRMLFEMADAGALAAQRKAIHAPGETWAYSSGTTNLLSKTLRAVLTQAGVDYHAFPREAVFDPIGAESVVMEPDAAGNFIGSSFIYATARDWARLGQLYLNDGMWDGARILPEGWAAYVSTPAGASDNQYGAHFWLNRDGDGERKRFFPGVEEEMVFMAGHEGQYVFIIPSKRMVIVRLGMTRGRPAMPDVAPLIADIYRAVGDPPAETSP